MWIVGTSRKIDVRNCLFILASIQVIKLCIVYILCPLYLYSITIIVIDIIKVVIIRERSYDIFSVIILCLFHWRQPEKDVWVCVYVCMCMLGRGMSVKFERDIPTYHLPPSTPLKVIVNDRLYDVTLNN